VPDAVASPQGQTRAPTYGTESGVVAALAEGARRLTEAAEDLVDSVLTGPIEDLLGAASEAAGELASGLSEGVSGATSMVAGAVSEAAQAVAATLGAVADALGGVLNGNLVGDTRGPVEVPAPAPAVPAPPSPAPAGGPSPSGGLSLSGGSGTDSAPVWELAALALFSAALLQGGKFAPRASSLLGPRSAFPKPSEQPG
jgi:hypothetical protein